MSVLNSVLFICCGPLLSLTYFLRPSLHLEKQKKKSGIIDLINSKLERTQIEHSFIDDYETNCSKAVIIDSQIRYYLQ